MRKTLIGMLFLFSMVVVPGCALTATEARLVVNQSLDARSLCVAVYGGCNMDPNVGSSCTKWECDPLFSIRIEGHCEATTFAADSPCFALAGIDGQCKFPGPDIYLAGQSAQK